MDIDYLKKKFKEMYGENDISIEVYFSPGRVNLIGEHTDYNGGYVFPCTISFGTYCLIRKTNKGSAGFCSLNMNYKARINISELNKPFDKEWVNYPVGVIYQFIKKGLKPCTGFDLLFYGDVPEGAGLSSSASLEMVTACAINETFGYGLEKTEMAKMAQKAEHDFAGVNCGIMDQFASGLGKKDHALFLDCNSLEYELVPIVLNDAKIIIANTNSPHKLDSSKYNERVSDCKAAIEAIKPYKNISQLGEISQDEFAGIENKIGNETIRKRARHVITEIERTRNAVKELKAGNIDTFGKLMNQSHDSLKNDYEVTGMHLDTMVEEAHKIEGVIGSRMTGGGFGGSTVSLVKNTAIDTFIEVVGKNYERRTGIKPEFYIAETVDGAHKIE